MEWIDNRRSIRKFRQEDVDRSLIRQIVRAGTAAPSAKNRQPWKFLVYTGAAKKRLLTAMEKGLIRERDGEPVLPDSAFGIPDAFHTLKIMREAPVLIMVLNTNGSDPYQPISTDRRISEICDTLSIGAALENMLLEAETLGLGTLWIANTCFAYPELVREMEIGCQLVCAVSVGYPDEQPDARPRKTLSDVLQFIE